MADHFMFSCFICIGYRDIDSKVLRLNISNIPVISSPDKDYRVHINHMEGRSVLLFTEDAYWFMTINSHIVQLGLSRVTSEFWFNFFRILVFHSSILLVNILAHFHFDVLNFISWNTVCSDTESLNNSTDSQIIGFLFLSETKALYAAQLKY